MLGRTLGEKQVKMVCAPGRTREPVVNRPTPKADRARFCLADADVLELIDPATKIEDHHSRQAGQLRPMDIEWAKDGPGGRLYIVQGWPETAAAQRSATLLEAFTLKGTGTVKAAGRAGDTKNLKLMVPFCRRLDEARAVLAEMARHSLVRHEDRLEVCVMCEIPTTCC